MLFLCEVHNEYYFNFLYPAAGSPSHAFGACTTNPLHITVRFNALDDLLHDLSSRS